MNKTKKKKGIQQFGISTFVVVVENRKSRSMLPPMFTLTVASMFVSPNFPIILKQNSSQIPSCFSYLLVKRGPLLVKVSYKNQQSAMII